MLHALGASSDPWLLQRYLLKTLNRDQVRPQDVEVVIGAVASNPEGRLLAWRHLKAYWPDLQSILGNGSLTMGGLIYVVTSRFFTEYDLKEVISITTKCLFTFFFFFWNCNCIFFLLLGGWFLPQNQRWQWSANAWPESRDNSVQHSLGLTERWSDRRLADSVPKFDNLNFQKQ